MPAACNMIRHGGCYKGEAFESGLERLGYQIERRHRRDPCPGDVIILWNRNRGMDAIASAYERAGGIVLIAENGYLGQPMGGGKFYALARGHHNGAGAWFVGDHQRFEIAMQPWRERGDHVLVLPQRGIGPKGVAMPHGWEKQAIERLQDVTKRPIRVRRHPGPAKSDPGPDLAGAHCAVTWGSGAGIKAIQAGIPVFYDFDKWIGACAAAPLAGDIEACHMPDRQLLWNRLSWAQWSLAEIASGEAFDRLCHEQDCRLFRTRQ